MFREQRFNPARVSVRASATPDSPGVLIGYASVFNSLSEDLGGFRERVAPTAYDRALSDPKLDCKALINHDPSLLIGRTLNKTLNLLTDSIGLRMTVNLPNTSYARDLMASVSRGDLNQMSFAFTADDEDWTDEPDPDNPDQSMRIRTLKSVTLMDVSAVTYPAYAATSISSIDPAIMGRSLFPQGVPMEVRSHVPNLRVSTERERRAKFVDLMRSL
jgi:uncharacterized protein